MKISNLKFYSKINIKYRKYILGLITLIFIISTILTIQAIRQPLAAEEKTIVNVIEEKTSYDYEALTKPSTLYPSGGKIIPDKIIYNNLTTDFIVNFDVSINSEEPVRIDAEKEVTYSIVAENMWERDFVLSQANNVKSEGQSNKLMQEEVHININDIYNYIEIIEEETLVQSEYMLIIKPKITGNVYDDNEDVIYELNNQLEIPFKISGQYLKYAGETEEKEFIKTTNIEDVKTVPQSFDLLGMKYDVIGSRAVFGISTLISFILITIYLVEIVKNKRKKLTEISIIDKKNKNKIISITSKIKLDSLSNIVVNNFRDLLKISEEKEESILKYIDKSMNIVYYYIVSSSFVYYYRCLNTIEGSEKSEAAQDT